MDLADRPAWQQYMLALALSAAATLLRLPLGGSLGQQVPFAFGFPAVAVASWYLATGPAFAVLLLTGAGCCLEIAPASILLLLPLYLLSGGTVLAVGRLSALAKRRAQALLSDRVGRALDLERAQAALMWSEAQFRQLADAMPQMVWIARPDGYTEYYNQRWYDYTGLSPEESAGHGWAAPLHEDDRARAAERWAQSIQTGEDYEIEYRFRSRHGDYRWFLGRALPVRDSSGGIARWFGTCTDIHDLKAAQEAREEAEERIARLFGRARQRAEQLKKLADISHALHSATSLGSVLAVLTEEARKAVGAHQCVSSLTLDGDPAAPTVGISLSDKYARWAGDGPDQEGAGLARIVRASNRPLHLTHPQLLAHPSFRPGPHSVARPPMRGLLAAPFVSRSGSNIGLILLSDRIEGDFTEDDEHVLAQLANLASTAIENARLCDALREGDRRKDEFLAILAHELRNPLAPIRTGLRILQKAGPEDARAAREMMARQVTHMVRLIDDLLDLSRINKGKIALAPEMADLPSVVARAVEAVQPAFSARNQSLSVELPDEPLHLHADGVRLTQVLVNLLANASRYTPEGGHAWLSARGEGDGVVLEVRDDGVGIAPDMLSRVFEMFTQERAAHATAEGGLGIGLTLARGLAELHGGTLTAASPGVGMGSTFTVRLPGAVREPAPARPAAPSRATRPSRRVLVVDDIHDSAESLGMLLRLMGQEVREAYDGPEAVRVAAEFRPDLVLLDIGMPGMSGLEVCRRLRRMPVVSSARIVAVTGYGQEEDRRRSLEAGFDRHLVKPLDPDVLDGLLAQG